jgi:malate synthase
MDAYVRLLIQTCHKRGVHAMGGMAAQIPIKDDPAKNKIAMDKVYQDKLREVKAGHDGTWVAHPALVKLALQVFDKEMPQPNQLFVLREDVVVTGADLISTKGITGKVTEAGVRLNINVSLQYMEAWLRGLGCVPIHNMMEDAATAEISRSQVWQWAKHNVKTVEGTLINSEFVHRVLSEEVASIKKSLSGTMVKANKFDQALHLLEGTLRGEGYAEFLTVRLILI